MNKEEFLSYSPEKQAILRDNFDFLSDIKVDKFGTDDSYLTKDGVPLNALTQLTESQFVKDWLISFAINNSASNQNYFNFIKWGEISNQHTMSVLIVEDNNPNNVLFIVKPLSSYEMSIEERDILQQAQGHLISSLQSRVDGLPGAMTPDAIIREADGHLGKQGNTPIHKLVPDDFYIKHGVYVESVRNVIWLKDEYFKEPVAPEVLNKLKAIFDKQYGDNSATLEEYEWVQSICPLFNIPEELLAEQKNNPGNSKMKNNQNDNDTPVDLFSC